MSRDAVPDPSPLEGATETTTMGESKPLHRFIRGEPKAVGIVLLILGSSQFILSMPLKLNHIRSSAAQLTGFWMGTLLMVCGLLFILTEIRPSKKLDMVISLEVVFMVHTLVGGVLLFVLSFFARAALRSTHTGAVVVMTTLPKE
ncbi:uncharacterized protein FYW47_001345 [Aplochiton taeniatus]